MLAATGAIAVPPFVSRTSHLPVVSTETRLVDASDSVLNIPANLFDDVVNIPANEVQGLDTAADSLLFNDNIFVVAAANIFGVDPGDPGHVAAIDSLIAPFGVRRRPRRPGLSTHRPLGVRVADQRLLRRDDLLPHRPAQAWSATAPG